MNKDKKQMQIDVSFNIKKEGNYKTIEAELSVEKEVMVNSKICISNNFPNTFTHPAIDKLLSYIGEVVSANAHISITTEEPESIIGMTEELMNKIKNTANAKEEN